jgi:hypothetical protein
MVVGVYMDVHTPSAITNGLRLRGVDVLTAQEDRTTTISDSRLLDRATELNRILYSQDADLLRVARERLAKGIKFSGVVFSRQLNSPVGQCIGDLELIAKTLDPADLNGQVEFIPT